MLSYGMLLTRRVYAVRNISIGYHESPDATERSATHCGYAPRLRRTHGHTNFISEKIGLLWIRHTTAWREISVGHFARHLWVATPDSNLCMATF